MDLYFHTIFDSDVGRQTGILWHPRLAYLGVSSGEFLIATLTPVDATKEASHWTLRWEGPCSSRFKGDTFAGLTLAKNHLYRLMEAVTLDGFGLVPLPKPPAEVF